MKKIINKISLIVSILLNKYILRKPDFSEKKIFLQGQIIDKLNQKKTRIDYLKDIEFSVFSQFGEDGIISWIVEQIPEIKKVFVEIGTQDYWESNTRFLLKSKRWKGYLIEGSKKYINNIKTQRIYWQHDIKAIQAFVDKDNINSIINKNINEKDIGLLSIDVDGNDYWILEKIEYLNPTIVVCEYNSIFGDLFKLSVPYNKNFVRNKVHYSNLYFGASIKAMISMMKKKGYIFIGTGSAGVNAFFVKNELEPNFREIIKKKNFFPAILKEGLNNNGKLTNEKILDALNRIGDLEVFDFDDNKIKQIKDYSNLYSDFWKSFY